MCDSDGEVVPGDRNRAKPNSEVVASLTAHLVELVRPQRDVFSVLVQLDHSLSSRADRYSQLLGLAVRRGPGKCKP